MVRQASELLYTSPSYASRPRTLSVVAVQTYRHDKNGTSQTAGVSGRDLNQGILFDSNLIHFGLLLYIIQLITSREAQHTSVLDGCYGRGSHRFTEPVL